MAENERFMDAIREDIMKGEEKAREEAALAQEEEEEEAELERIRRGHVDGVGRNENADDDEDY